MSKDKFVKTWFQHMNKNWMWRIGKVRNLSFEDFLKSIGK